MSKDNGTAARILDALASLKLTLFLFFTLAAASIIGTLLPQGTGPAEVQQHFSPAMASVVNLLGLNNLYHTMWFRIMLLLLCVNLLACTLDRLPKTVRLLRRREDPFDSNKLSKFGYSRIFPVRMQMAEARSILKDAVAETFGPLQEQESAATFCAVNEKGRWSRLMVYGVHLSVLVVLAGALTGSVLGFKGFINLPEGSTTNEVALSSGDSFITLPFEIRCDKFDVSFYDNGAPKDYRSDLVILDGSKEVVKESIRVNDPLTYNGVTFYQASYGTMLKEAEIELKDRDSGNTVTMTLPYRAVRTIPGTKDQLQISEYQENLMRVGPALGIVIGKEGQESLSGSWILVNRPDFHGNRVQNYQIRVLRTEQARFTGLQVKKDPGVWLVWAGFSVMVLCIGLTFYSSHKKLWVCAEPDKSGKGLIIAVAGRTSRNAAAFEEDFNDLCTRLENRLKPEKEIRA